MSGDSGRRPPHHTLRRPSRSGGELNRAGPIGAVLLAAGESSRLGQPKQLLMIEGRPLVRASAEAALAAGCTPAIVVLGAWAERVGAALRGIPVRIVVHRAWADGIASSIRAGIDSLRSAAPDVDGVLLMVADQPCVDHSALTTLVHAFRRSTAGFVAAEYAGTVGVPAIFDRTQLTALGQLGDGDRGASALLRKADPREVVRVRMPQAAFDVDTPDDAACLCAAEQLSYADLA